MKISRLPENPDTRFNMREAAFGFIYQQENAALIATRIDAFLSSINPYATKGDTMTKQEPLDAFRARYGKDGHQNFNDCPCPGAGPAPVRLDPAGKAAFSKEVVSELEAQLAAAKERAATAEAERLAAEARIEAQCKWEEAIAEGHALAQAQSILIGAIESAQRGVAPSGNKTLAKYRRELAEIAGNYGYRIVLVGNKEFASVVAK